MAVNFVLLGIQENVMGLAAECINVVLRVAMDLIRPSTTASSRRPLDGTLVQSSPAGLHRFRLLQSLFKAL